MASTKLLVLPSDAKTIIAGIAAAADSKPIDPTVTDLTEKERLARIKWLPPLTENTDAKVYCPFAHKNRNKEVGIRFPANTIREGDTMKLHLKYNPTARFVLAFREKAKRSEGRAKAYEESLRRHVPSPVAQTSHKPIRPLSRDPIFIQQIRELEVFSVPKPLPTLPIRTPQFPMNMDDWIPKPATYSASRRPSIAKDYGAGTEDEDDDEYNDETEKGNEDNVQGVSAEVPPVVEIKGQFPVSLVRSKSYMEAQKWFQSTALWNHMYNPVDLSQIEEYDFGKPKGMHFDEMDEDVFNGAFMELYKLGSTVGKIKSDAERDKVFFDADRCGTADSDGKSRSSVRELPSNPYNRNNLHEVRKGLSRTLENPVHTHITSFTSNAQDSLFSTLRSRAHDRLQTCQKNEAALEAIKLTDADVRRLIRVSPSKYAHTMWDGIVPYFWYPAAYSLVKNAFHQRRQAEIASRLPPLEQTPSERSAFGKESTCRRMADGRLPSRLGTSFIFGPTGLDERKSVLDPIAGTSVHEGRLSIVKATRPNG